MSTQKPDDFGSSPDDPPEIDIPPLKLPKTVDRGFRHTLAIGQMVMIALIITLTLVLVAIPNLNSDNVKDVSEKLLMPLLLAYGITIGYYFGKNNG